MSRKLACVGGSRDGLMVEIPEESFLRGYFEVISSPDDRSPCADYANETYLISACAVPMARSFWKRYQRPPMVFFARHSSLSGDEAVRLLQRKFFLLDLLTQERSSGAG